MVEFFQKKEGGNQRAMKMKFTLHNPDDIPSLDNENLQRVIVIKIFHLYQRRNEWVNWGGDTSLVKRDFKSVTISLNGATDFAEELRRQGTKFFIDEIPALCFIGRRYALVVTELFSDSPLAYYKGKISLSRAGLTLGKINSEFMDTKWLLKGVYAGDLTKLSECVITEKFYRRESGSTGSKDGLGWSLDPRKLTVDSVGQLIEVR